MTNATTASLAFTLILAATVAQGTTLILSDDFSAGSVANNFRVYENQIDDGWLRQQVGPSEWTISGGVLQNSSTTAAAGYPANGPAEAPVSQIFSNTLGINDGPHRYLNLSFDYSVGAGDSFYAHFWGVTGVSNDDAEFISNIEGGVNGAINNTNTSAELVTYNLLDGSTTKGSTASAISGLLTGSGTFSTSIDITSLGITGVDNVNAFTYFFLAFAQDENGAAGITSIDNLSISAAVPEPSTALLLGVGLVGLVMRRRNLRTVHGTARHAGADRFRVA